MAAGVPEDRWPLTSADRVHKGMTIGALGCRIGRLSRDPGPVHPDAEAVRGAVQGLTPKEQGLVIGHAIQDNGPQ